MIHRKYYKFVLASLLTISLSACLMNDIKLTYIDKKAQEDYPSGSTISNWHGKVYIMGDDATELLVLNEDLQEQERVFLFPKGETLRTPKKVKADIESSVLVNNKGTECILLFGSGSSSPQRDSAYLYNPKNNEIKRLDLSAFYDRLRTHFKQLNIEAAANIGTEMVLGIRANTSYPDNFLAVTSTDLNSLHLKRKIMLRLPVKQTGISGMDYDHRRDILFITFSTESTPNAFDDGEVGDSYLAIVEQASQKLKNKELEIESVTKLTDLSNDFLSQKIESVSLMTGKDQLLLVADDDLGNTTLFRLGF